MADPKLRELEKKVKERKKLVERIAGFVEHVTVKHGKRTYYSEGSCNTHTQHELKLGNFFLKGDLGQTMYGGNTVDVVYKDQIVFSAYFQGGPHECLVSVFEKKRDWLVAIKKLIQSHEKAIERLKKREEVKAAKAAKEKEKANKTEETLENLLKEAKRLGLS